MLEKEFQHDALELLNTITTGVPVEWDRVAGTDDVIKVFGWIQRRDGKRDFLLVKLDDETIEYTTSSAKYSKVIARLLGFEENEHKPCILFGDFFRDAGVATREDKVILETNACVDQDVAFKCRPISIAEKARLRPLRSPRRPGR